MSTEYNSSPETKRRKTAEEGRLTPKQSYTSVSQGLTQRRKGATEEEEVSSFGGLSEVDVKQQKEQNEKWKRILLLVIAITVHNIPGNISDDSNYCNLYIDSFGNFIDRGSGCWSGLRCCRKIPVGHFRKCQVLIFITY